MVARCVVLVVAAVAVLVVGDAGRAYALGSGSGWYAWWRYETTDTIKFEMRLPGVHLWGQVADDDGIWLYNYHLVDTAKDGRCAELAFTSNSGEKISSTRVCDTSLYVDAFVPFVGGGLFRLYSMQWPAGIYEKTSFMFVPGSVDDPTLRTVGTGAKWVYTSDHQLWFEAERPHARISGAGYHYDDENRVAIADVVMTQPVPGCVEGALREPGASDVALACVPNSPEGMGLGQLDSWLQAQACYSESIALPPLCIGTTIPEPS